MSCISSFDIISVVVPDHKISLCLPASAADVAAANPNGIKSLLTNGLIISKTFTKICNFSNS